MASFKAKFPVLQELFAKKTQGAPCPPPSGARNKKNHLVGHYSSLGSEGVSGISYRPVFPALPYLQLTGLGFAKCSISSDILEKKTYKCNQLHFFSIEILLA